MFETVKFDSAKTCESLWVLVGLSTHFLLSDELTKTFPYSLDLQRLTSYSAKTFPYHILSFLVFSESLDLAESLGLVESQASQVFVEY